MIIKLILIKSNILSDIRAVEPKNLSKLGSDKNTAVWAFIRVQKEQTLEG